MMIDDEEFQSRTGPGRAPADRTMKRERDDDPFFLVPSYSFRPDSEVLVLFASIRALVQSYVCARVCTGSAGASSSYQKHANTIETRRTVKCRIGAGEH